MAIDYQTVIDMITQMMYVAFPVALIFVICSRVVSLLCKFIGGKDVRF